MGNLGIFGGFGDIWGVLGIYLGMMLEDGIFGEMGDIWGNGIFKGNGRYLGEREIFGGWLLRAQPTKWSKTKFWTIWWAEALA